MNIKPFIENFEILADAPNGVEKLRKTILQLAVQGKLVPQDPDDEPASILLQRLKSERGRLTKEGFKKYTKSLPTGMDKENLWQLPNGWEWTRLTDIGLINPRNEVNDGKKVSFIPMAFIPAEFGKWVQSETRFWKEIKGGFTHFAEGDVAVAKITPCFQNGKSVVMRGLINGVGVGTTELHVFRPADKSLLLPEYVLLYVKSPDFLICGEAKMTGSAGQKRVPKDYFSLNPFPLPPFAEQKRIVAKVDHLMGLCDELEERKKKRSESQLKLNGALLDKMLSARDPKEFAQHWQRICDNFDLLYDRPETVQKLRQAILQLAVQGKLVPQNPNDEPASILLKKIQAEKQRLIKEGRIRNFKPSSSNKLQEQPYKLSNQWEWVRLEQISIKLGSGSTPRGGKAVYEKKGIPFIRSQNVWNDGLKLDNVALIPEHIHERMRETTVEPCDILLNITGASIGRSCIVPDNFLTGNVSQHVAIVRLVDNKIRHYIHLCLISPYLQSIIMAAQVGISREGLSMKRLKDFLIPLPPLSELERIVTKVDQLMALCDELETKLRKSLCESEKLIEAVVHHMLNTGPQQ
ncbi:MAG: restriction endonuclease subunit S [Candidatus Abyssobacteria bacterium SURF_5]|uniref:Restriction endonuclease subunit S n=1 Tax=Abyssobacteria bacterium (strain SURF_5) TaxID=2093360 RepID=A0A3A4NFG7_ABYX5|nr:MAG: restriction endonuclease subunit S [Candidatus Abyssubacteria bacterium SURF_5]